MCIRINRIQLAPSQINQHFGNKLLTSVPSVYDFRYATYSLKWTTSYNFIAFRGLQYLWTFHGFSQPRLLRHVRRHPEHTTRNLGAGCQFHSRISVCAIRPLSQDHALACRESSPLWRRGLSMNGWISRWDERGPESDCLLWQCCLTLKMTDWYGCTFISRLRTSLNGVNV